MVLKPEAVEPGAVDEQAFAQAVGKWVQQRVAPHKFLRGGVHLIDQIPKSCVAPFPFLCRSRDRRSLGETLKRPSPVWLSTGPPARSSDDGSETLLEAVVAEFSKERPPYSSDDESTPGSSGHTVRI